MKSFLKKIWTGVNERLLNIETDGTSAFFRGPISDRIQNHDNVSYQTADYFYIRQELRWLRLSSADVFYDIGCGKGRVICLAGRYKVKKIVGIDFDEELCRAAERNVCSLRGRKSEIEVRCEDALKTDLEDGSVFFLYNPFGETTMASFVNRLAESWRRSPRPMRVLYHNARHAHFFQPFFKVALTRRTLAGESIVLLERAEGELNVTNLEAPSDGAIYLG